jgi:hypothetical protein
VSWFCANDIALPEELLDFLPQPAEQPPAPTPATSREVVRFQGAQRILDVRNSQKWELESRGEGRWEGDEGCWTWFIDEVLYRQPNGKWYLVSEHTHFSGEVPPDRVCEQLTEAQAAERLLLSGHSLPGSLAAHAKDLFIDGPPEPEVNGAAAESTSLPQAQGPAAAPEQAVTKLTLAIALKFQHPKWTNKKIAKAAGCTEQYLSNSEEFQLVRDTVKGLGLGALKRGFKTKTGQIEAYDQNK